MKVIIVGAGIGGLTAALELAQRGIETFVYESVEEVKPLGVGINLLPHAMKNYTRLGLQDALVASGIETQDLTFYNKFGKPIWNEPRGRAAGYRYPQVSIHRGELQMILYRAAKQALGDRVRVGHHLDGFENTGDGRVLARFVDRRTGRPAGEDIADVLIGADGIHSTVRRRFYPNEGEPRWNGVMFWRAAAAFPPFLSGRSMIMAGYPDLKFIAYPMSKAHADRGGALINWATDIRFDRTFGFRRQDWNRRGDIADFIKLYASWRFDWLDVPALIRAAEAVYEFPCVDREPLPQWTFGRVTLLGDAAHPMHPMGSNGASQAIRDAYAIAEALTAHGDPAAALRAYEAGRRPATAQIVLANRMSGPERVMALVEERAPDGFNDLDAVISPQERQAIADDYKRLAGFDRESVNADA